MRAKILTLLVLLLFAGCSSVPSLLYKIEIQQGNVITQEMVDKLKPGMTRSQVRFALGSPMISDAFHDNRWDYVYRLEQKGRLVEQRKLTVFFEDDKLVRTDGSFSPSVAFARPQSVEPPAEYVSPVEPALPVVKEESSVPASSDLPASSNALAREVASPGPEKVATACAQGGGVNVPNDGTTYGCVKKDGTLVLCGGTTDAQKKTCTIALVAGKDRTSLGQRVASRKSR